METITRRRPKGSRHKYTVVAIIICILVGALIAAGVVVFLNRDRIFVNSGSSETTNNDQKDTANSSAHKSESNGESTKNETAPRETEKASVSQYEGGDPNELEAITGNINYAGISGENFIIRATLDQALGNSGTCSFTLTSTTGIVVTDTSSTNAGPTTSFCSYSIPAASITSGYWTISVKVTGGNKEGIITGEVSI